MLNELFGPSIFLLILELFLDHPDTLMNLREIARKVDKNPGSISRVLPRLIEQNFLDQVPVSKERTVYRLNTENEYIKLTMEFHRKLKNFYLQKVMKTS